MGRALVEAEHGYDVLTEVAVEAIVPARARRTRHLASARIRVAPARLACRLVTPPDRLPRVPLCLVATIELPRAHMLLDADGLALQHRSRGVRTAGAAIAIAAAGVALACASRPQVAPIGGVTSPALLELTARAASSRCTAAHAKQRITGAISAAAAGATAGGRQHSRRLSDAPPDIAAQPLADAGLPYTICLVLRQRTRV